MTGTNPIRSNSTCLCQKGKIERSPTLSICIYIYLYIYILLYIYIYIYMCVLPYISISPIPNLYIYIYIYQGSTGSQWYVVPGCVGNGAWMAWKNNPPPLSLPRLIPTAKDAILRRNLFGFNIQYSPTDFAGSWALPAMLIEKLAQATMMP